MLFCLERLTQAPSVRPIARQHGILPVLLRALRSETDGTLREVTLQVLESYGDHVTGALLQQRTDERIATLCSLNAIARGRPGEQCTAARRLLEYMAQDESLRRLMSQVGYLRG